MGSTRTARPYSMLLLSLLLTLAVVTACSRGERPEGQSAEPVVASTAVAPDQARTAPASGTLEVPAPASSGTTIGGTFDRFVIRTGELELQVSDVGQALVAIRQLAIDAGGFVLSSSTYAQGEEEKRQTATLTIQVPSDRFDQFLNQVRTSPLVVEVEREQLQSQDVTEEYLDLDARLRNLQATEQRYLALLDRASTIEEILRVEQELSRVRYEIEQVTGRKQYLERHIAYAQATITLVPVPSAQSATGPAFDLARAVERAWQASLRFIGGVAEITVMVLVFFWWLWPVLAALALLALRWRSRRQAPGTTNP
ncbi:DUF4349 domain-containing protein [Thermomicrobiaceae bacterium CFH 74404]|uniref:DUF4349 domain-containing protein n=1 Tax=Thermalbibacter longus TaxID=2951981 RepID=A0AA41WHD9_9BACT|nr:DUF4349 domain-containing protein [Thermalbibacter longus]MCM8750148.1 DUF4349 domain-containing protein [Thermalbibacter longus]